VKEKWDGKYSMIYQSWDRYWDDLSEFSKYPPEIRCAIYTTNAVETMNYQLRKVTKNRSAFSTDDAILKILYLTIRNVSKKWTMPIKSWGQALNQVSHCVWKRTGSVLMIFSIYTKNLTGPRAPSLIPFVS